jgi:hypothetical protein
VGADALLIVYCTAIECCTATHSILTQTHTPTTGSAPAAPMSSRNKDSKSMFGTQNSTNSGGGGGGGGGSQVMASRTQQQPTPAVTIQVRLLHIALCSSRWTYKVMNSRSNATYEFTSTVSC